MRSKVGVAQRSGGGRARIADLISTDACLDKAECSPKGTDFKDTGLKEAIENSTERCGRGAAMSIYTQNTIRRRKRKTVYDIR